MLTSYWIRTKISHHSVTQWWYTPKTKNHHIQCAQWHKHSLTGCKFVPLLLHLLFKFLPNIFILADGLFSKPRKFTLTCLLYHHITCILIFQYSDTHETANTELEQRNLYYLKNLQFPHNYFIIPRRWIPVPLPRYLAVLLHQKWNFRMVAMFVYCHCVVDTDGVDCCAWSVLLLCLRAIAVIYCCNGAIMVPCFIQIFYVNKCLRTLSYEVLTQFVGSSYDITIYVEAFFFETSAIFFWLKCNVSQFRHAFIQLKTAAYSSLFSFLIWQQCIRFLIRLVFKNPLRTSFWIFFHYLN